MIPNFIIQQQFDICLEQIYEWLSVIYTDYINCFRFFARIYDLKVYGCLFAVKDEIYYINSVTAQRMFTAPLFVIRAVLEFFSSVIFGVI